MAIKPKTSGHPKGEPPEPEDIGFRSVEFLGHQVTESQYREICRNLGEFFKLLAKWKKESERV